MKKVLDKEKTGSTEKIKGSDQIESYCKAEFQNQEKRGKKLKSVIAMALVIILSGCAGYLSARYGLFGIGEDDSSEPLWFAFDIAALIIAFYIQMIIHEGGHLIFGLLTGYRFSSFRIGNLMLIRLKDGLHFKKMSLAGTGGQCIMKAPDYDKEKFPYKLYNMGGVIMNLISAAIGVVVYLVGDERITTIIFLNLAITGVAIALMNGIPANSKDLANDGSNTLMMMRSELARKAVWLQLKANEKLVDGVRLREMPAEWFELPEDADLKNMLISSILVYQENRLVDKMEFEKAEELTDRLLAGDIRIIGVYRSLLKNEKAFFDILRNGPKADLSYYDTKEMKQFLKAMKTNPSVIRTAYAKALLFDINLEQAATLLEKFEKCAASYPNVADIESERELLKVIEDTAERNGIR